MSERSPKETGESDISETQTEQSFREKLAELEKEYFRKIERMKKDAELFLFMDELIENYLKELESESQPDVNPRGKGS